VDRRGGDDPGGLTAPVVRAGRPEDRPAVAALLERVFVGGGFTRPEAAPGLRAARDGMPGTAWLVAVARDGRVVGSVHLVADASPVHDIARAGELEVQLLAVASEHRGRGVGRALVTACLERARVAGVARVVLSTQPTMHAAHRLYELLGFRRVPARDWERGGTPRLVYVRELAEG
jgi:ribosomal protein S18 acetylase RimI-like enzyme